MEKFWQACQQTGKEEKKEIVYNYLTGPEFRNRVQVIMEAFVNMKELIITQDLIENKIFLIRGHRVMLSAHLAELERKIEKHDTQIRTIFEAIRQLMSIPEKPKRRIGFHAN